MFIQIIIFFTSFKFKKVLFQKKFYMKKNVQKNFMSLFFGIIKTNFFSTYLYIRINIYILE
jgi:hypothetical protein